jgi:type I restriction enzyme S subunit
MESPTENRPGYKKTKLGWIPDDWDQVFLSDATSLITNGFVGKATDHYTEDVNGIIYIQGYNVKENSFNLNGIKRVTLKFHEKNQKSNLKEGDLLTVQTGDIGLTTIVPKTLVGSNCHALIISRFLDGFHSQFYSFYYNSHIGRASLRRIETGSTMKHLNVRDMQKWPVPVPPLPEQKKIAQILSTWDKAIAKLEALIAEKEQLKKGLMQQLLTGKKRFPGFTEEWTYYRLEELLSYEQPTKYIVRSTDYDNAFETPVLTAGKTFILGYTKESEGVFSSPLPVIIFDDFTTSSHFVDFPFKVKSSAMKILKPKKESINLKLVFELMKRIQFKPTDHKRYWISQYSQLEVLLPSEKEQNKLASFIKSIDNEYGLLMNERDQLIDQKKGLMQKLLTGEVRVKIDNK